MMAKTDKYALIFGLIAPLLLGCSFTSSGSESNSEKVISDSASSSSHYKFDGTIDGEVLRVEATLYPYRNNSIVDDETLLNDAGDAYLANTFDEFALTMNAVLADGTSVSLNGWDRATFERNNFSNPSYYGNLDFYVVHFWGSGESVIDFSFELTVRESDRKGRPIYVRKKFDSALKVDIDDENAVWDCLKKEASELFPWSDGLNKDDLERVRYESGAVGATPGSFRYIFYSEQAADKEAAMELLDATFIETASIIGTVYGGVYHEYSFAFKGEEHTIRVNNGYVSIEDKLFRVSGFKNEGFGSSLDARLGFTVYQGTSNAHSFENEDVSLVVDCLKDLEFVEWPNEESYSSIAPSFYIDDLSKRLEIYEARRFSYDGKMYRILGEADFSSLFVA